MRQITAALAAATALSLTALSLTAPPAAAQTRLPSHCIAVAEAIPQAEYLHLAALRTPLPDAETVRITYVDHAMFLIEAGDISIATDFTGYLGQTDFLPDVVTMNHAHSSHWTANPDPRIPHVLRGWNPAHNEGADHWLDLGDVLIRNVPTDIRSYGGVEEKGNSIFIFEAAGLCIGHLGHLHHEPSPEHYAAIGRLDIVMAPVDGGLTVPVETMAAIVSRLRSSIVLPMHWFGRGSLDTFLADMSGQFAVEQPRVSTLEISLRTLPSRPTIMVLEPRFLE